MNYQRRCMSCLLVGTHSRTCPDLGLLSLQPSVPVVRGRYTGDETEVLTVVIPREPQAEDTLAGGLSWTGVIEAFDKTPQSHAKRRSDHGRVPVWALASVFLGAVLMAFGFVMNEPVSQALWTLLHK